MSLEIESRVLSSLIMLGEPTEILAQEAMLQLSKDLFRHHDSRDLFIFIEKQFHQQQPFDYVRIADSVPKEIFDYLNYVIPIAWSNRTLIADVKFLIDSHRALIIDMKLKNLMKEIHAETLPSAACTLATNGCMEISKMGIVDENHIYTAEMCAENYYADNKKSNKIIPSGIETLDKINEGGFKENCLITIAGRSGMGKTGFAVHLAHHLAANHPNKHVLFYSLEMSFDDIYEKRLAAILGQQPDSVKDEVLKLQAVSRANEIPFTIDTKPMASINYIETTAKITSIRKPLSVIVVDYLGLVQNTSKLESHTLKQADIALRLAALAAQLNCIVIALTQVNRDYSNRDDKVPITSDAADSSGSERSSSYWLGIYRPEADDDPEHNDRFIVKCRKNRFGKLWSATFAFQNATFGEVDQIMTYQPAKPKKGMAEFYAKGK